MTFTLWHAIAWLALGILGDFMCEAHAKKLGEPYRKSTQVACYLVGPLILPLALTWVLFRTIAGKK